MQAALDRFFGLDDGLFRLNLISEALGLRLQSILLLFQRQQRVNHSIDTTLPTLSHIVDNLLSDSEPFPQLCRLLSDVFHISDQFLRLFFQLLLVQVALILLAIILRVVGLGLGHFFG